jgi:Tfp pilus assembly protein PilF
VHASFPVVPLARTSSFMVMMRCLPLFLLLCVAGLAKAQGTTQSPADQKFNEALLEVRKLAAAQQHQQALDKLAEAESIKPNNAVVHNARGSVYTSMKDYGKARESFAKAEALKPGAFESRFNLTELDYVQGNYEAAAASFTALLAAQAKLPLPIRSLVQFKVLVCKLKLGKVAEAEELVKSFDFKEGTPPSFFTKALHALQKGDQAAANEWLAKAQKTFKPGEIVPYLDALVEARLITLQGSGEAKK